MKKYNKKDFPVSEIRRFLEPGPIVLVSSKYKEETNIMTMGWHTVLEFTPSLIGCMITSANHSFNLIKKSKECVINIPELHLAETVVGIGNCSGRDVDKFDKFGLTAEDATMVKAPLIAECYAHFECKIHDAKMLNKYNFFIFEVVKAHAAVSPKYPETIHYRGEGHFMVSGKAVSYRNKFLPQNL
ncbi:flavin reductase family protein [Flavobacterium subsaxonicum]|uniref:Flavin reductase n=1 Tax=Flavobacterium subsaxonicum WB 4.1-42 = DSM 21790 TaxID=1121898 RepID=A0A0A2MRQ2_9FLAO|nr:flavin reductase family protein [Flavobacterium subsaxonicum]KGO95019.1 flavin reductase [Flavobacterium subsaxonicum WB 4.1-42 = DSM 21790]